MSAAGSGALRAAIARVLSSTTLDSAEASRKIARCLNFGFTLNEAEMHLRRTFPRPRQTRLSDLQSERNGLDVTTTVTAMTTRGNRSEGACTDGADVMPLVIWGTRTFGPNETIRIVGARTKLWNGKLQLQIPESARVMKLATPPPEAGPVESEVEMVLFACTGNTCRSPMAEILLNEFGEGRFMAYSERAIGGKSGVVATGAQKILTQLGIAAERVQSAALPPDATFSRMFVMDDEGSTANFETAKGRRKGTLIPWVVNDPIGGDYAACYQSLRTRFKADFEIELPPLA